MTYLAALGLSLVMLVPTAEAQVSGYTFAQTSGTYTPITGGTVIATATSNSGATGLDDVTYPVNFTPYSFTFNGTAYSSLSLSTNGFITLGAIAASSSYYTPISGTTAYDAAISAWGGDLSGIFNVGGITSEIRWELVGSSPNQELVVQWKDFRPSYSSSSTVAYRINMQIRLQENGSKVQIAYGPNAYAAGTTTYSGTRQIGLRGATNAAYNNRSNGTTVLFGSSVAGTINSATQAYNTVNATPGMPANGLTYTWTPPSLCSGTPAPGNTTGPTSVGSG
ncbi:MAG: hypothetical protein ACOH13_15690, partial [Flavobacteriales bacterium]